MASGGEAEARGLAAHVQQVGELPARMTIATPTPITSPAPTHTQDDDQVATDTGGGLPQPPAFPG